MLTSWWKSLFRPKPGTCFFWVFGEETSGYSYFWWPVSTIFSLLTACIYWLSKAVLDCVNFWLYCLVKALCCNMALASRMRVGCPLPGTCIDISILACIKAWRCTSGPKFESVGFLTLIFLFVVASLNFR